MNPNKAFGQRENSIGGAGMEDLPPPLILEILSRLNDSFDLARCRIASRTFDDLSRDVRFVNLQCSFERYTRSRSPDTRSLVTPFKSVFKSLISGSRNVDSVSVGVDKPLRDMPYDDDDADDDSDDLYLTDVKFVSEWLPAVSGRLRSISISDFWIQSCWRRSEVLSLISSCCHNLVELELKNAWVSVDGLSKMPSLKILTLEFIRLDDEDLNKVNDCFPNLQVLNLIGVGGLKEPRIHLLHLQTCHWTVSNAPNSLTIVAPCLVKCKIKCITPGSLVINAPLLSDFHLSIIKAYNLDLQHLPNLKHLQLESADLIGLVETFPSSRTIRNLNVDSFVWPRSVEMKKFSLKVLFDVFPHVTSLALGLRAWSLAQVFYEAGDLEIGSWIEGLNSITAHLSLLNIRTTKSFIAGLLEKCINLTDVMLIILQETRESVASSFISECMADHPRVRWNWRT